MISAMQVKEMRKGELLNIPGVVGVGIGKGSSDQINIYVREKTPELVERIPKVLDGLPTRVIQTGTIKALPLLARHLPHSLDVSRTGRIRPAPGGCSIGHIDITAGTLSTVVRDNLTGKSAILSNVHVFNPDPRQSTMPRYDVLQPGAYDSGTMDDKIADVIRWVPLSVTNANAVDCALAMPLSDGDVSSDIIGLGPAVGTATAQVDGVVSKSGRTTAVTSASVIDVSADVRVGYESSEGEYFEAVFTDQIVTDYMAAPGDSGSLLMNDKNQAIGLLFAGSDTLTVHNKIQNVMSALNISIAGEVPPSPPPVQAGMWLVAVPLFLGILYSLLRG